MNYYEILGVSHAANSAQIKRAYRLMVKQYHPDINPTPEAHQKIRDITIAYEVLSDPYTKEIYDLQQVYAHHQHFNIAPEPTPEQEYRRVQRQKVVEMERRRIEQLFRLKSKFYSIQRMFCFLFLGIAIVFSIDYFVMARQISEPVDRINLRKQGTNFSTEIITPNFDIETDESFYNYYDQARNPYVQVYFSSIFDAPSMVGLVSNDEVKTFSIAGTIHSYGNVLSYALFLLCMIIIQKRRYSDWALTLAIIPFFIVAFLMALLTSI